MAIEALQQPPKENHLSLFASGLKGLPLPTRTRRASYSPRLGTNFLSPVSGCLGASRCPLPEKGRLTETLPSSHKSELSPSETIFSIKQGSH
jgi:hypothetical protein